MERPHPNQTIKYKTLGVTERTVELGVGHSGTRNSSRTEIPSSGELALTNKERMVTVASVGLLRPITPAPKVVAQRQNFSEAECSVIEAEDKE